MNDPSSCPVALYNLVFNVLFFSLYHFPKITVLSVANILPRSEIVGICLENDAYRTPKSTYTILAQYYTKEEGQAFTIAACPAELEYSIFYNSAYD